MIHVIAHIQTQPGQRAEVLAEFQKLIPKVQAEDGCLEYGPAIDADTGIDAQHQLGGDVFTVIEQWESVNHLKAHLAAPHMDAYREAVKDLVVGVMLHVLEPA